MARAVICDPKRRAIHEPLYDIDPRTGTSIEVFYVDQVLAQSFGAGGPGWFWWSCQRGCLPDDVPTGPFANSYLAYRDAATRWMAIAHPTCRIVSNAALSAKAELPSSGTVSADTVRTRDFPLGDANS